MGGPGSGRGIRWTKAYCEDYLKLDIRKIARAGALKPHQWFNLQWTRRGGRTSDINISVKDRLTVELSYTARDDNGNRVQIEDGIEVSWSSCKYGGERPWWICPGCCKRVAVLYGGKYFRCRKCHGLAYGSQSETKLDRMMHRLQARRIKLGADGNMFDAFPPRPKGMHKRTYERESMRAIIEESRYWGVASKALGCRIPI